MKKIIMHNKLTLGTEEIKAVTKVIETEWISQGEVVKKFEDSLCDYIGLSHGHAIALSSGTSSLYLALKILDVKKRDEVIIPTYTCSALLNALFMAGGLPIIADVNDIDFNISCEDILKKITPKTKAIIVPHAFGIPANIAALKKIGIPIIEDCATSLGSKIQDRHLGIFGDIAIFSFYASKVITTGQGGMIVSKRKIYIKKAEDYREFDCRKEYYPRFNFQMTDLQASMGVVQLKKLASFLEKRRKIAESYKEICYQKGFDFQKTLEQSFSNNWYRFVLKAPSNTVISLKSYLERKGIFTIVPIERWELLHNYLKLQKKSFGVAEKISSETLSLPIYPDLIEGRKLEIILKHLRNF